MVARNNETKVTDRVTGEEVDPFEVDNFNEDDYEVVVEDDGTKLDLNGSPDKPDIFYGTYRGIKEVIMPDSGEVVRLILLKNKQGTKCCIWVNYALNKALDGQALTPGREIRIAHYGKQELDSGKTVNRITVHAKK